MPVSRAVCFSRALSIAFGVSPASHQVSLPSFTIMKIYDYAVVFACFYTASVDDLYLYLARPTRLARIA